MKVQWLMWGGALCVAVAAHAGVLSTLGLGAPSMPSGEVEEYDVLLPPLGSLDAPLNDEPTLEADPEPAPQPPEPAPKPDPQPEPVAEEPPEPEPEPLPIPMEDSVVLTAETDAPTEPEAGPAPLAKPVHEPAPTPSAPSPGAAQPEARFGMASGVAEGQENFAGILQAWFMRYKRYPHQARARRMEGVVRVWFRIDRDGNLLESRIEQSCGHRVLDEATLELLQRAAPFPAPPEILHETDLIFTVPIAYRLH